MDAIARTIQRGDKVSGWGIAETAPEIEKIKAESADYLNGLNSCGEVSWEVYDYAFDFYVGLIQKAYELGKSEAEPHWIPVTERLPDNGRNVLITSRGGVSTAWYNGSYFEKGANTHHRKMQTVTAWCELPEPYKGVTE